MRGVRRRAPTESWERAREGQGRGWRQSSLDAAWRSGHTNLNIIDMFLKGSEPSPFFGVCPGTYFLCPVSKPCPSSSSSRIRRTTTPSGARSVNIPPGSRTIREFTMWCLPKWIFHRHIKGWIHTTGTPNFTDATWRSSNLNPTHCQDLSTEGTTLH